MTADVPLNGWVVVLGMAPAFVLFALRDLWGRWRT